MAKFLNRQVGRFRKRTADEADVGLLISEINYLTTFLDAMIEQTQNFRRAWTDILDHQANISAVYIDVYRDIPGSTQPGEPTPIETLDRLEHFHRAETDLKDELQRDLEFMEKCIIDPLRECKGSLKGIYKGIKRRENKKLDYEKYVAHVDTYKKKRDRSRREDQILQKGEMDLEGATMAFKAADDYLRDTIPPFLEKFSIFLPLILDVLFTAQNTFAAQAYTTVSNSAAEYGFSLESDIVGDWESQFMQYKEYAERELVTIRTGNAVRQPMSACGKESFVKKATGTVMGRGRKGAPPPPPSGPPRGSRLGRPSPSRSSTAASIKSRTESLDDEDYETPPPVPIAARPTNGLASANSTASLSASEAAYRARQQPTRPSLSSHPSDASWIQPASVAVEVATRPGFQSQPSNNGYRKPSYTSTPKTTDPPAPSSHTRPASTRPPSTPGGIGNMASAAAAAAAKKKPPPPPPKKKFLPKEPEEVLTALYDFQGQSEGDLSFRAGDRIRVVKKTENLEDWWRGVVVGGEGRGEGAFPRNYME